MDELIEDLECDESSARQTAFASEDILGQDWDKPEEDAAWTHV